MTEKFYTNVEVRGNNILYRGYENGLPVEKKIAYKPHLFIGSSTETKWKSFSTGQYLKQVDFETIDAYRDYIKRYEDIDNFRLFGCENLVRQYIANEFRGDIAWSYEHTQIWMVDIETRAERGFPKPEIADQEILLITMFNHNSKKMYTWTCQPISSDNKIYEFDVEVRLHDNERDMLKDFLLFWRSKRIDVISGWNSELFDVPYLVNRIKNVLNDRVVSMLSPWNVVKERFIMSGEKSLLTYDILGITHLDYMEIYKKFTPGQKESYRLDFIAELELGKNKVELPGESFKDSYDGGGDEPNEPDENDALYEIKMKRYTRGLLDPSSDEYKTLDREIRDYQWNLFVYYNAIDVHLLHEMELNLLHIRLAMQVAYIAKCNYGDVMSAMRIWESIINSYFLDQGIVEDLKKKSQTRHKIIGAYVHDPKPTKRGWVISIDATSLYPSIMMQNNISPECIVDYIDLSKDGTVESSIEEVLRGNHVSRLPDGCILSPNGLVTSKEKEGFISTLTKRMFDLRKQTKNRMLDLKKNNAPEEEYKALDVAQSAFKVANNSFYGILLLPQFKYYDYRMGEAITSNGQVYIIKTKEYVNEILTKILGKEKEYAFYCDTDSVVGDTLVYANGKQISISNLYDQFEKYSLFDYEKQTFVKPVNNVETLSFNTKTEEIESKPIKYIMKHAVKKRMFKITIGGKSVIVTEDHSVIVKRNGEYLSVSPMELSKHDILLNITTQQGVSVYEKTNNT